jgi:hypothetical protein
VTTAIEVNPRLSINVGPLNGLGSLCLHTAGELKKFSDLYLTGNTPLVEWDLRQVEPGRMSMAGLTAFLSIADRMRQFSGHAHDARVQFKPRVFAFWHDVRFLQIARDLDLVRWTPENIVGGYGSFVGTTNPNSLILAFREPDQVPLWEQRQAWARWKDDTRQTLTCELLARCGQIFDIGHQPKSSEKQFVAQVSRTAAELVLNAHYWGRAAAFVGLQRSTAGVTVAVCDTGRGFLASLSERAERDGFPVPSDHVEAIVVGSLLNSQEYGLRQAIDQVVDRGGWVTISSYDSEVRWGQSLWPRVNQLAGPSIRDKRDLRSLVNEMGHHQPRTPQNLEERRRGYWRKFSDGLRGVRIAFELPSL